MTNLLMRIDFNTNRQYSPEGQPIVAFYKPDEGLVRFADLARSMHGEFEWAGERDAQIIQEVIMHKYDRAEYQVNPNTKSFYQFEKRVWNDVKKEKNRSQASRHLVDQLSKLENLADDIRAQFEEIADEFHQDEGPALDPQNSDSDTSYDLYELAYDIISAAEDLHQQISEFQQQVKEVTK